MFGSCDEARGCFQGGILLYNMCEADAKKRVGDHMINYKMIGTITLQAVFKLKQYIKGGWLYNYVFLHGW